MVQIFLSMVPLPLGRYQISYEGIRILLWTEKRKETAWTVTKKQLPYGRGIVLHNHPPITIHEEDRKNYYEALEAWDTRQELEPLYAFLRWQTAKTWEKQTMRRGKSLES